MRMIEVLSKYENGEPRELRWIRNDGIEMYSLLEYEETFNRSEERQSYVVWGTVFHIDSGELELIEKRFFSKEFAEAFYQKLISKYPQSRVKFDMCIPIKKYY